MFKRFVEERKLIRISVDRKLILKEIEGAISDLEEAKDSLSRKKSQVGYYTGILLDVSCCEGSRV